MHYEAHTCMRRRTTPPVSVSAAGGERAAFDRMWGASDDRTVCSYGRHVVFGRGEALGSRDDELHDELLRLNVMLYKVLRRRVGWVGAAVEQRVDGQARDPV